MGGIVPRIGGSHVRAFVSSMDDIDRSSRVPGVPERRGCPERRGHRGGRTPPALGLDSIVSMSRDPQLAGRRPRKNVRAPTSGA